MWESYQADFIKELGAGDTYLHGLVLFRRKLSSVCTGAYIIIVKRATDTMGRVARGTSSRTYMAKMAKAAAAKSYFTVEFNHSRIF